MKPCLQLLCGAKNRDIVEFEFENNLEMVSRFSFCTGDWRKQTHGKQPQQFQTFLMFISTEVAFLGLQELCNTLVNGF